MLLRYFLALALLPALTSVISAQETATKVSDFDYGIRGENIITALTAIDDQLYANLSQIYGDDAAGLISTIDSETGAPTAFLSQEQTTWYGGALFQRQPVVFEVDGKIFGIQQDVGTGSNLYRLDGERPEILATSSADVFSRPVILGDSLYFLAGSLPVRQSPLSSGEILAELYRTDGTAAGTEMVTSLFALFQSGGFARVVAGEDKLLIDMADRTLQVFYFYEPGEGLSFIGEGFGQFLLGTPRSRDVENPVAYHNGGFYVYGNEGFFAPAELYRIDEETAQTQLIPFPEVIGPFGPAFPYTHVEFQNFNDSLYLFTARNSGENGNDLYRISGTTGLDLVEILVEPSFQDQTFEDYFSPFIANDTLYYLSRGGSDNVTLYAYHEELAAPRSLFTLSEVGESAYLIVEDDLVYITLDLGGRVIRYDKSDGTAVGVQTSFFNLAYSIFERNNPIAVTSEGAYWVTNDPDLPVVRLQPDQDSVTTFGNFQTRRLNPIIRGRDNEENKMIVVADQTYLFDPTSEAYTPLEIAPSLQISGLDGIAFDDNGVHYFLVEDTLSRERIGILENGVLVPAPFTYDGQFNPDNYLLFPRQVINDSMAIVTFFPDTEDNTIADTILMATFNNREIELTGFVPTGYTSSISLPFSDEYLFILPTDNPNDGETYGTFDYEGNELYVFTVPENFLLRYVTANNAFVEGVDPETFEPQFRFISSANVEVILISEPLVNSRLNRTFFNVNGRILFMADTPDLGREWAVADPANGTVSILKDINPGNGWSRLSRFVDFTTSDGLFFDANDGTNGSELWFTDGTTEGTQLVADLNPGEAYGHPTNFTQLDSTVFFSASGPSGLEIYRMQVSNRNPELIIDLNTGEGSSHPFNFTLLNEAFYFIGREAAGETFELYRIAFDLVPTEAEPTRVAAKVFPNPAHDLPLTVVAPEGETLSRMQLFNQQGQLLREVSVNSEQGELQLTDLPAGTYWLRSWYASGRFSINAVQRAR